MADEELAVEVENEAVETEETEQVEGETPDTEQSADDEIVVTIGDESPTSEDEQEADGFKGPAPEWVKELRKSARDKDKKIRELEAKLSKPVETKPTKLGAKPRLEDFDFDEENHGKALDEWYELKIAHDAEQAKVRQAEEAQQREWQAKLDAYNSEKSKTRVRDYEEAEAIAQERLSQAQQGIILHGLDSKTATLAIAALGSNTQRAKEIAAIKDPVMFAIALGELKKDMTVNTHRKAPPPEKTVTGSGSISTAVTGSNLERLKERARQTGDWSDYFAAKRKIESK